MFETFTRQTIDLKDVAINAVVGGEGPPVLLLHGYPQTHAQWSGVAPLLAERFTVVCADLRGYGDSSKPEPAEDHSTYSFRAMAADQVTVMRSLGHDRFHVAGHDRGGRVAHRMALDSPEAVTSLSVLDLVPTWTMYMKTDRELAALYWQWYYLLAPHPFPERMIGNDPDLWFEHCLVSNGGTGLDAYDPESLAEYRRCWNDPAMIRATCTDYRAGYSVDLELDRLDRDRLVDCPTLALWGVEGLMGARFDVVAEWSEACSDVRGATAPGGHFFPDHAPEATARVLEEFFTSVEAVRA
jgi:haloacetate dehalogenase